MHKTCAAFACKAGPGSVATFVLLVWTDPYLYKINKGEQSREKLCIHPSLALPFQRGKLKSTSPSAVRRKIVLSELSPTALVNTSPGLPTITVDGKDLGTPQAILTPTSNRTDVLL